MLHPLIHQETQRQLTLLDSPYVIWVVPLLIENNLAHLANRVLVIDVTPEEQIARIIKRDGISQQEAKIFYLTKLAEQGAYKKLMI